MNINSRIKEQLLILRDLDLIIYSPDFQNASYDKQRELIVKKQEGVKKLQFLYGIEDVMIKEKRVK